MNPGTTKSIDVTFTPIDSQIVKSDIMIEFLPGGGRTFIGVTGQGQNVEIIMSTTNLHMHPCFISLQSHKTMKIKNASSESVSFSWKSYKRISDEDKEKNKLLCEINRMEDEERNATEDNQGLKDDMSDYRDVGEEEEKGDQIQKIEEEKEIKRGKERDIEREKEKEKDRNLRENGHDETTVLTTFNPKIEDASFIRKYRNLRYALDKDNMEFIDDVFDISPLSGTIWPNSEMEIAVIFRPDVAGDYKCLAYLDVFGREDRLPLHLTGNGIGPKAYLSFDTLDIGDVFISLQRSHEITITNRGDITAIWSYVSPNTKFGSKFLFYPEEGFLHPNEKCTISITFESDILGEFNECLRFSLHGNEHMLSCQIKGRVIGPTFYFNSQILDFGSVSFDYLHTQSTQMKNTSAVPLSYRLHIPQDGIHNRKEFNITPHKGTILSGECVCIVTVTSTSTAFRGLMIR